jgi:hypothetical protein
MDSLRGAISPASPPLSSKKLRTIIEFAIRLLVKSILRYKSNGFFLWLVHKETASILSLCFVITSVFFMAWSAIPSNLRPTTSGDQSAISDPNFLGNLSQSLLSNLSVYLMITATVHSQSVGLRYQSWFWVCLGISSLSSVLGLSLYASSPLASVIFLWVAAFAQVVIPILLMIKAGVRKSPDRDDVERHGD